MKTCKRCFREFEESEFDVMDVSPVTELADIMLRDIGIEDINDLCPQCREELGDGSAGVWPVRENTRFNSAPFIPHSMIWTDQPQ